MSRLDLRVNGRSYPVDAEPDTPLLYILRNDLQLNGPRFGCGLAQCGACTVIVRGTAVRSCVTPVGAVQGVEVTTLEGLGTVDDPHPIQRAFIEEQAAQCGYCINGMIMTAKAFVDQNPAASDSEIRQALAGNLCRCGTHLRILRAVHRYAEETRA
jgi:nicotinate dehydrogenase subunit A